MLCWDNFRNIIGPAASVGTHRLFRVEPFTAPNISNPPKPQTVDLTIGNFRVSYLDFRVRSELGLPEGSNNPGITAGYTRDAMRTLLDIGMANGTGPDVFHLEWPFPPTTHDGEFVRIIRSWLRVDWPGQFVVSTQKMNAFYATQRARLWHDRPSVYKWFSDHRVADVIIADETSLTAAAIHESIKVAIAEGIWPGEWSSHYHRRCSESDMNVCSPVCDSCAQQILNIAFRGKKRQTSRTQQLQRSGHKTCDNTARASRTATRPFRFCLRCPVRLVPFTVRSPFSEPLACHDYLPASRT